MRATQLVIVVLSAAVAGTSGLPTCQPGAKWSPDEFTVCKWTQDCMPDCYTSLTVAEYDRRSAATEEAHSNCEAGETWKEFCDECECVANGLYYCSYRGCPDPPAGAQKEEAKNNGAMPAGAQNNGAVPYAEEAECEVNTTWKEDCNDCWCMENGMKACSKMGCDGFPETNGDATKTSGAMPAGAQNNGAMPAGAQNMGGAVPYAEEAECEPNSTWKEDCNDCWCMADGFKACSKMGCNAESNSDATKTSVAMPAGAQNEGAMPAGAQNMGGAVPYAEEGECEPNSTWKEDCNDCWCMENGMKACTKMGCDGFPETNGDATKTSGAMPAGAQNNGAMPAGAQNMGGAVPYAEEAECEPNSTWKEDCNDCWCMADGFKACTYMGCDGLPETNGDATKK